MSLRKIYISVILALMYFLLKGFPLFMQFMWFIQTKSTFFPTATIQMQARSPFSKILPQLPPNRSFCLQCYFSPRQLQHDPSFIHILNSVLKSRNYVTLLLNRFRCYRSELLLGLLEPFVDGATVLLPRVTLSCSLHTKPSLYTSTLGSTIRHNLYFPKAQ